MPSKGYADLCVRPVLGSASVEVIVYDTVAHPCFCTLLSDFCCRDYKTVKAPTLKLSTGQEMPIIGTPRSSNQIVICLTSMLTMLY